MAGHSGRRRKGFPWIAEPPLSPAVTVAAIIGAVILVVGSVLTSGDEGFETAAAEEPVAPQVDPAAVRAWYASTEQARTSIVTTVAAARGFLDAQDGLSLQPRCTQLMEEAKTARQLPAGPDTEAQRLYASGVASYQDASQTCRHLFNGSQISIEKLQAGMRTAFSEGDRHWAELATRIGLPAAAPLAVTPAPDALSATSDPRAAPTARSTAPLEMTHPL